MDQQPPTNGNGKVIELHRRVDDHSRDIEDIREQQLPAIHVQVGEIVGATRRIERDVVSVKHDVSEIRTDVASIKAILGKLKIDNSGKLPVRSLLWIMPLGVVSGTTLAVLSMIAIALGYGWVPMP